MNSNIPRIQIFTKETTQGYRHTRPLETLPTWTEVSTMQGCNSWTSALLHSSKYSEKNSTVFMNSLKYGWRVGPKAFQGGWYEICCILAHQHSRPQQVWQTAPCKEQVRSGYYRMDREGRWIPSDEQLVPEGNPCTGSFEWNGKAKGFWQQQQNSWE